MSDAMIPAFRVARAILVAASRAAFASTPAPAPTIAMPGGPRPVTGGLAGAAASARDEGDRARIFAVPIAAAQTGRRASGRGTKGHFGSVVPGPGAAISSGPRRPIVQTVCSAAAGMPAAALPAAGMSCVACA
ncbi:MAG: hypothetical protein NT037_07480 [Hyphomicrobiales bacterium]|nr:hypothetical protein [Hyphomicrobiales bacterium]